MWLEQQCPATRERINNMLRRFKAQLVGIEITGDMRVGNQIAMDLDDIGEYIEIPVFRTEAKDEREDEILR